VSYSIRRRHDASKATNPTGVLSNILSSILRGSAGGIIRALSGQKGSDVKTTERRTAVRRRRTEVVSGYTILTLTT
jgi:hypothetical protein